MSALHSGEMNVRLTLRGSDDTLLHLTRSFEAAKLILILSLDDLYQMLHARDKAAAG